MPNTKPKTIEELTKEYRERLLRQKTEPPLTPEQRRRQRAERLMQRLARTETSLEKSDHKRLRDLLEYARVQADMDDLTAVYGACVEVCQMARARLLGLREAHPITASVRPPSLLPAAGAEDEKEPEPP